MDEQPTSAIIRSKVQSPVVRASTLERRRLLGWLERHTVERVCFVSAEAGYGKTTLLADYARRSRSTTLWYRLETSDRDWSTFLGYLVAAVRESVPEFGFSTTNLLAQVAAMGPTLDVAVGTLLAELNELRGRHILLILDDFHLVQESQDVQAILERMFELAPEDMAFVLAGRRSPGRRLARLEARGQVATLTTDDLRFSRRETEELFSLGYGMALDDDIIGVIDARTEGWVASLQLVYSSIRSSAPHEVREFVRDLSGTSKPLYDFLAEEVLGRQTPLMQRILIHASLLVRISADLVLAALSVTPDPPSADQVADSLEAADEQGLMSRSAAGSATRRFHPLLREFLHRQLISHTPADLVCQMHLRIAVTAEPTDWLTAAHHYVEGGAPHEAMRVLSESTMRTLGTGAWGAAIELVDRMPEIEPPLAVQVIRARALVAAGKPAEAVALIESLVPDLDDPMANGLARLARATAYYADGRGRPFRDALASLIADDSTPPTIMAIATAWTQIVEASTGGRLGPATEGLVALARDQVREDLHYFAAVSLHNAMCVDTARGRFVDAIALGDQALDHFRRVSWEMAETASTRATIAICTAELGRSQRSRIEAAESTATLLAPADALADNAWLAAATGNTDTAWQLTERATRLSALGASELGSQPALQYARVMIGLAEWNVPAAELALASVAENSSEVDAIVRNISMRAVMSCLTGRDDAGDLANQAMALVHEQGAYRWESTLQVVFAVTTEDSRLLRRCLAGMAKEMRISLLAVADIVGSALWMLDDDLKLLDSSIVEAPNRWLPILRRQLTAGNTANAHAAANLLVRFGLAGDVPRLVAFEWTYVRKPQLRVFGGQLARRVAPTLVLHDLGRSEFRVGGRDLRLSQTRRKAASLLVYLASRPRQAATREQVLEELWPDLDPAGAVNSLHQTLYFLRRHIDPWYEDRIAVDYVALESEMAYLDPDLVQVDSVAFLRQASAAIESRRRSPRRVGTSQVLSRTLCS